MLWIYYYDFEDIEVKANAPQLLEKALKSKRKKCMIGTGAMCDPYLHAEEKLKLTRRCLELIDKYEYGVAIQTKSTRILRIWISWNQSILKQKLSCR